MFKDNKPTEYIVEDSRNHDLPELCYGGPMGRLPAELLAQVFEHCLPSDTFSVPVSSQAPLLLAHTCPRWRSVALSTPSLWSTLHIVYKDPSLDVPMASNWLQRSGCLPLSVCISIDFNEQSAQEILDVLCEHASRWKHVRFEFRGLYCPPMYTLSLAENNTPLLRAFEFNARDISSANITPIISLLNSAPELREVTWVDDLADTRRLMELPLSRLTLLSITMSHGTLDYLELLDQCYNLEHIRITRPRPGDTRSLREPLVLSKLTSLNIVYDLTAILDSLVLPALKHVRIHAEGQADRSSGRSISAGGEAAEGTGSGTWSPMTMSNQSFQTSFRAAKDEIVRQLTMLENIFTASKNNGESQREPSAEAEDTQDQVHGRQSLEESRNSRVVVLIDGDGCIFTMELISGGREGGKRAARMLGEYIREDMKKTCDDDRGLDMRILIFYSKGLKAALRRQRELELADKAAKKLEDFRIGFTQASEQYLMANVGRGKDVVDSKLRAFLRDEVRSPRTHKVVFGGYLNVFSLVPSANQSTGCHDGGYVSDIETHISAGLADKIVLLHGYEESEMASSFKNLGLHEIKHNPNLFIAKKMPSLRHLPSTSSLNTLAGDQSRPPSALGLIEKAAEAQVHD
ncbi:hypothetical protein AN958_06323 [Leucoagaricus sp. SymC.cos]|nr:hypothetical protein AN958_06323 [Leucoagaricus sp. SymC.cos]